MTQRACPLFVPLVEEGWFDHQATELVGEEYLGPVREAGVGALVLGCTHYPLLKPLLRRVMGPCRVADRQRRGDGGGAGRHCRSGASRRREAERRHRFAVSDDAPRFLAVGGRFLGDRLAEAEVVDLSP